MTCDLTAAEREQVALAVPSVAARIPDVERIVAVVEAIVAARIAELEAQVAGLEAMNTEKAAEIRRLRMGNHPAGRALRPADEAAWGALREALTDRDAEHEGGEGA